MPQGMFGPFLSKEKVPRKEQIRSICRLTTPGHGAKVLNLRYGRLAQLARAPALQAGGFLFRRTCLRACSDLFFLKKRS